MKDTRTDVRINLQEGSPPGGVQCLICFFAWLRCRGKVEGVRNGGTVSIPPLAVLHLLMSGPKRKRQLRFWNQGRTLMNFKVGFRALTFCSFTLVVEYPHSCPWTLIMTYPLATPPTAITTATCCHFCYSRVMTHKEDSMRHKNKHI